MYYDLIASLPYLPHFELADRLPITPLRLQQRLRRLRPEHASELSLVRPLIRWRPEHLLAQSERSQMATWSSVMQSKLDATLRDFIDFRMTQQTLLALLRRKAAELEFPDDRKETSTGPLAYTIRRNWDKASFGLMHQYPFFPRAAEMLAAGDAIGLERLLMNLNWQWLSRRAERSMFAFEAVVAFVLKWDMLRAWLNNDPNRAQTRFTQLIDEVTHVANA